MPLVLVIAMVLQACVLALGAGWTWQAWRRYRRTLPGVSVTAIWLSLYRDP